VPWGTADPTIVSLELLRAFGAAPLAASQHTYIVYQIVKGDPMRYYRVIVLCPAELYSTAGTCSQKRAISQAPADLLLLM